MSSTWGVSWGTSWGRSWDIRVPPPPPPFPGFILMLNQFVPNNDPAGMFPVPVSVPGAPTRARFTFSLSGPSDTLAEATVYASVPGFYYPGWQIMYAPILVMVIPPGEPHEITQDIALGAPYNSYSAVLNLIEPGQQVSATLTMEV